MNHSSQSFSHYRFRCHLVAGFVCLLFGGIQYFASTARTAAVRTELDATLNQRRTLVDQSEALEQRLLALQSEENDLKKVVDSLRKQIPFKADDHAFLESLAHQADEAGMEVLEFQPGRAELEEQFEKVPVKISAVCNWSQLCHFLYSVKGTSRLCSVDEVRISVPAIGDDPLQIHLTITIFSSFPTVMAQAVKGDLK